MKEFPLKTPKSGPHGLTVDKDGNIWYTGNSAALIGKLNPKTGEVTEYKMPDPAARDPHTPIFDKKGTLWFTLQGIHSAQSGNASPARRDLERRRAVVRRLFARLSGPVRPQDRSGPRVAISRRAKIPTLRNYHSEGHRVV